MNSLLFAQLLLAASLVFLLFLRASARGFTTWAPFVPLLNYSLFRRPGSKSVFCLFLVTVFQIATANPSFAQAELANILKTSNTKIIIDDPAKQPSQAEWYMQKVKELQSRMKEQQHNEPLLAGLKIRSHLTFDEGVSFPASMQKTAVNFSDNRFSAVVSDASVPPCSESVIIKKPGKDKNDKNVWLDTLYMYQGEIPQGKTPADLYGSNVSLMPVRPNASPFIYKTMRAEGAKCIPFRHIIVGDTDYKIYGAAALVKR